jgi:hypothetical protein
MEQSQRVKCAHRRRRPPAATTTQPGSIILSMSGFACRVYRTVQCREVRATQTPAVQTLAAWVCTKTKLTARSHSDLSRANACTRACADCRIFIRHWRVCLNPHFFASGFFSLLPFHQASSPHSVFFSRILRDVHPPHHRCPCGRIRRRCARHRHGASKRLRS